MPRVIIYLLQNEMRPSFNQSTTLHACLGLFHLLPISCSVCESLDSTFKQKSDERARRSELGGVMERAIQSRQEARERQWHNRSKQCDTIRAIVAVALSMEDVIAKLLGQTNVHKATITFWLIIRLETKFYFWSFSNGPSIIEVS